MTALRRSVLTVALNDGCLTLWPPPDLESVPDAVILRPSGAAPDISAALTALTSWNMDCILDVDANSLPDTLQTGVTSLLVRATSADEVHSVAALIDQIEAARAWPPAGFGIELFVLEPHAFLALDALLGASTRVKSVITDVTALWAAFGVEPDPEVDPLAYPRGRLALAAAHSRIPTIGLFEPAGHHRTIAGTMNAARFSFAVGLHGGLCRTWDDVRACNRGFTPDDARVARARRIIEAMEEAGRQGLGAINLDGRMIDLPFIRASETTLHLAEQVAARSATLQKMFIANG